MTHFVNSSIAAKGQPLYDVHALTRFAAAVQEEEDIENRWFGRNGSKVLVRVSRARYRQHVQQVQYWMDYRDSQPTKQWKHDDVPILKNIINLPPPFYGSMRILMGLSEGIHSSWKCIKPCLPLVSINLVPENSILY
ncbi:hypothetical protein Lal_00038955 [Lupinus albus]|nr:hypothetical protein Lal_00038955 [Lupinus albus]